MATAVATETAMSSLIACILCGMKPGAVLGNRIFHLDRCMLGYVLSLTVSAPFLEDAILGV